MTRIVRDALSAIVLMCVVVTAPVAQSTVARPQARPATPAQPPGDPDQEVETIGTPEDDELQQLIAQAEALAAEESPASDEAIALISEELEALKAGLALKAALLEAGEDTTEADMEIAARSESLQAAIDATTEPDSSDEPAPIAKAPSPERGKHATHIDAYVGEALSLLTKIQELLAIHRDDVAGTESGNQGDANPSEETLQDVTGVITESGEPVAGVRVTDPESGAEAVTDAEGQYTLQGLPAGRSAHLILSKSGAQVGEGQLDLPGGRDGVGDFDLKPAGGGASAALRVMPYAVVVRGANAGPASKGAVSGTLRDAAGRPVPRALVSLGTLARARTNSRGQYVFLKVPAGTHEVKASTPGFPTNTARVRVAATRVDASMSLRPRSIAKAREATPLVRTGSGVQMRGAVTSAAGQAVGAAKVTLMRSGKAVSVRSGARGDFLLRNLEAGRYRVLVSKAGYRTAAEIVSLEAGANRVHRYQLEKTVTRVSVTSRRTNTSAGATGAARMRSIAGRVVGRVFDAATGKPVRGASIAIQGHEPVTTNAAGAYSILSLRPARYRVVVKTNGFAPADRDVVVSAAKVARLDFGVTRDRSHAVRSAVGGNATTVSLTGRVLDARTRRAIARAVVSAGARRIAADSAGRFTVPDLRPGVHRIVISADGYQMASEDVTVRANDRTNVTFTLIKGAAPVRRR